MSSNRTQFNEGTSISTGPNPSSSNEPSPPSSGSIPSISLPKGGAAMSGIGEKFQVNPATGTAALSIPIVVSPSRGLNPQLSLTYNSGYGNGEFGLGWDLSLSAITRKTDKGIPRYLDAMESDVFLLSGAEDLLPIFKKDSNGDVLVDGNGNPIFEEEVHGDYVVRRYSPRVDQSFHRIERWIKQTTPHDGQTHWRIISPNNITSVYGRDDNSKIYDPQTDGPERKVFSWLIAETYHTRGNAIIYKYKEENSIGVNTSLPHEANRTHRSRSSNRYITSIHYGNTRPNRDQLSWEAFSSFELSKEWLFTIAFDYGEYDLHHPTIQDDGPWLCRDDPFSSYRSGFEVRTYRLCRRIHMFHHFPTHLNREDYLVNSITLDYDQNRSFAYLTRATHIGYMLDDTNNCYLSKSLPPLEFEYSRFPTDNELSRLQLKEVDSKSVQNTPYGVDGGKYQWIDLDGEGLSGILTEQASGWFYKHNLSPNNQITVDHTERETIAKFGAIKQVCSKPAASLNRSASFFADVVGDGLMDLTVMGNDSWGFYKRDFEMAETRGWMPFHEFKTFPHLPSTSFRFLDLTGDGLPDILLTDQEVFRWYPALGADGYGKEYRTPQSLNENEGPRLVFSDPEQTIYLADMSGDGLTDLLRVRNGDTCYWPNTGYGTFGAKVTMDNSPCFAEYGQFNQQYIHIADIDGSGTNDIIYTGSNGVDIYLNQAGNGFSDRKRLSTFVTGGFVSVEPVDLLGTGTMCMVWSSTLPSDIRTPLKYVDITNGRKPHLLVSKNNNMGGKTLIHYAPSTKFYLDDKQAGRPWITRLPFPVQCVEEVELLDSVSHTRFVNRYAYHHGYFDGYEREYRGFAMVEQWNTEEFGEDLPWGIPPVYTKTWFHTGIDDRTSFAREYFSAQSEDTSKAPFPMTSLEDSFVPFNVDDDLKRDLYRALTGHVLRQEIYSQDGSKKSAIPYTVTTNNYTLRPLQKREDFHHHYIVTVHPRDTLTFHFERNQIEPRVNHTLVLETDEFGNVLKKVDAAYGRKRKESSLPHTVQKIQERTFLSYSEYEYTTQINTANDYLLPQTCQSRTYQLYDVQPQGTTFSHLQFTRDDFAYLLQSVEIQYDEQGMFGQKRLFQQSRTLYRSDDLFNLLPLGEIGAMALVGETYTLATNSDLIQKTYQRPRDDGTMESLIPKHSELFGGTDGSSGGYVDLDSDGSWWIPSGRSFFSLSDESERETARKHFFVPRRFEDPFGNISITNYDSYDLSLIGVVDAVGNSTYAHVDYRTLKPDIVTDPNGNRTQCAFDELGFVVGTAVMGKVTEQVGDTLEGFQISLTQDEIDQYFNSPKGPLARKLLAGATTRFIYDFSRFVSKAQPNFYSTIIRETHFHAELSDGPKTQIAFTYLDGIGRQLQVKSQAGDERSTGKPQWITNGWSVLDSKGQPVRQFEPVFEQSHIFMSALKGISSYIFHNPLNRVIGTLNPNHTWTKSVFSPWHCEIFDANDTVTTDPRTDEDIAGYIQLLPESEFLPTWMDARAEGQMGLEQRQAAAKASKHANTPGSMYLDALGREVFSLGNNGREGKYHTRVILDIQSNLKEIVDHKGRIVMRYERDMTGQITHQSSMEAGERWILKDVKGKLICGWDSRNNRVRNEHDALRRPVASYLQHKSELEALVERTVYGDTLADPQKTNSRTRVVQLFDQTGVLTNDEYDFKGNLLSSIRQLAKDYKSILNWNHHVPLETSLYNKSVTYDALNRIAETTAPDNSQIRYFYNEAGLINQIDGRIREEPTASYAKDIQYNAKGQRTSIQYGNSVHTSYSYDPLTSRLIHLKTKRPTDRFSKDCNDPPPVEWPGCDVQNIRYTYDPVGNITYICDEAQQTIFFRNKRVDPSNDYSYDPLYRLIEATGREHVSLASPTNVPDTTVSHPHDGKAMCRYTERYNYDELGNFLSLRHSNNDAQSPGWTRNYEYNEPSLLESGKRSNRLSITKVGSFSEAYHYDRGAGRQGNITRMSGFSFMKWDFKNQLRATARQVVRDSIPETTWYVYDAAGQRIRKVTERQAATPERATRLKERLYLGGFEIYRKYQEDGERIAFDRHSITVTDNDQKVAMVEYRPEDHSEHIKTRYQLVNHLGSVSLELDEHGEIISYEEYTAYGHTSYFSSRVSKRFRYVGKEWDKENGLYYFGHRYYHPGINRWLNCDPIGIVDGLNVYAYVGCNPIVMVDPDGRGRTRSATTQAQAGKRKSDARRRRNTALTASSARIVQHGKEYASEIVSAGATFLATGEGEGLLSAAGGAIRKTSIELASSAVNTTSKLAIIGQSVAATTIVAAASQYAGEGLSIAGLAGAVVVGVIKSEPAQKLLGEQLPAAVTNTLSNISQHSIGKTGIAAATAVVSTFGEYVSGEDVSGKAVLTAAGLGAITSEPIVEGIKSIPSAVYRGAQAIPSAVYRGAQAIPSVVSRSTQAIAEFGIQAVAEFGRDVIKAASAILSG